MQCGRFPKRPFGMATGTDPRLDARGLRAAQEHLAVASDRVGVVRIRMRVTPRPRLTCDGQFVLDRRVERFEIGVADRPVGAYAVVGVGREVGRVEPRGVAGVVDHRTAYAAAGVVRAQRHGVDRHRSGAARSSRGVCAALVGDPVGVGIPERACVQADDPPPGARQPLGEYTASCSGSDDDQIHLVAIVVAAHVGAQPMVGSAAVVGDQPGRLVAVADLAIVAAAAHDDRAAERPSRSACSACARSTRCRNGTGSGRRDLGFPSARACRCRG